MKDISNERRPFHAERDRDDAIFSALNDLLPDGADPIDWAEAMRNADAAIGQSQPPGSMALARCRLRNKMLLGG